MLRVILSRSSWRHRPANRSFWRNPVETPVISREAERLQRILEGQNFEIRRTLWRYSSLVEAQRRELQERRTKILMGEADPGRDSAKAAGSGHRLATLSPGKLAGHVASGSHTRANPQRRKSLLFRVANSVTP